MKSKHFHSYLSATFFKPCAKRVTSVKTDLSIECCQSAERVFNVLESKFVCYAIVAASYQAEVNKQILAEISKELSKTWKAIVRVLIIQKY